MWLVLAVVFGLCVGLVLLVVVRRPAAPGAQGVDPIFVAGISIAGASAALVATLGLVMIPMMLVGLVFIGVGLRRTRHHPE